jgi:SAM-dependent methyltransferase
LRFIGSFVRALESWITMSFDLTASNAEIFQSDKLADWYAGQSLCPAETIILLRHRNAFAMQRVLDLGVGSGRTTRYLLPFAASYLGIDLSSQMLARCKRDFPSADLRQIDIRAIGTIGADAFDFVMASWAVLDALAPEDRAAALRAVAHITARSGMLVLSAHNREAKLAGRPPSMVWQRRPDRLALEIMHYCVACLNYNRLSTLRVENPEYALFNDMAHRWQGVFYYIDREQQCRQLDQVGFDVIEIVGEDGRTVTHDADVSGDGCLHYVAVKR